jgi:CTP synthase (UTP-ammonia lyase)
VFLHASAEKRQTAHCTHSITIIGSYFQLDLPKDPIGYLYWKNFYRGFSLTRTALINTDIEAIGGTAMDRTLKIGIIGDYNPDSRYHIATHEALGHSAAALSIPLACTWIPTQSLAKSSVGTALKPFHALWCAPGSPYKSMDGALEAIKFAREQGKPFMGT